MPRFHHVNLAVLPGVLDSEADFLVQMLGYAPIPVDEQLAALGARWFAADDGSQVHLSEDPEHGPAARAHVAIDLGDQLAEVQERLERAGTGYPSLEQPDGSPVLLCRDPGGNRWELRG